jgi:hypothetical protein
MGVRRTDTRVGARIAAVAAIAAMALIAVPAAASATTLWVAQAPTVTGNGRSCTSPGYNTIQGALSAAPLGASVSVCGGTYEEQLQITQAVSLKAVGSVTVKLPAAPANSTTACDTAPGTGSYQPDQDLVAVCGTGVVKVTGFTFEAYWAPGTCDESLYGILVGGGATLQLTSSTVLGAGAKPINGCQGGVGIQVGMAWTTPAEAATAKLVNDSVQGYQKNGITVDGPEAAATITTVAVTGAGATPEIAQNGIQVSNGALGKISKSTITANECNNASCSESAFAYQATGLLFYGARTGSSVATSTISENDVGVFNEASSPTPPPVAQLSITGDTLTNDRYESVLLSQGWAKLASDTLSGGKVGIEILQYNDPAEPSRGESYGPRGSGTKITIKNMTEWAILGASNIPGTTRKEKEEQQTLAGYFQITVSEISGNPPGASVAESVHSQSPTLNIFATKEDT